MWSRCIYFLCVDIRDRPAIREHLYDWYFEDVLIDECIADIEGKTLEYYKGTESYITRCNLTIQRNTNNIVKTSKMLLDNGVPKENIVVIKRYRNDVDKRGGLEIYGMDYLKNMITVLLQEDVLYYPDKYIFEAIDIRDRSYMDQFLSTIYDPQNV